VPLRSRAPLEIFLFARLGWNGLSIAFFPCTGLVPSPVPDYHPSGNALCHRGWRGDTSYSRVIRSRAFISRSALLALLALAGGVAILGARARLTYYSFALPAPLIPPEAPTGGHETDFLAEMTKYTTKTQWVVTDMPMYAFRVGLPVPPPLAAITDKRLASGEVSEEQIIQVIDDYQPEQVLMGRFNLPVVEAYLKKDYRRIYQWGEDAYTCMGSLSAPSRQTCDREEIFSASSHIPLIGATGALAAARPGAGPFCHSG